MVYKGRMPICCIYIIIRVYTTIIYKSFTAASTLIPKGIYNTKAWNYRCIHPNF